MKISILSVFPTLYESFLQTSLIGRAQDKKLIHVNLDSFFSFVSPKERIDAPIFGPGAGMLIRPDVVERAVVDKEKQYGSAFKIFFSPQGQRLNQRKAQKIAQAFLEKKHLMLLPARYEGMDARVEEYYADEIISVGDFVMMSGDIAAMMLLESVVRLLPGVVGKQESIEEESFVGPFVEHPHYTVPVVWKGFEVPEIIRSGNHAAIEQWRTHQSAKKTVLEHFDWLRSCSTNKEQRAVAREYIPPHYCALLHSDVLIGKEKKEGTTSVTSIDIHDIARSAKTYNLKHFFIVTPLHDQQKIVQKLLDFWQVEGPRYNKKRFDAIKQVQLKGSLDEVCSQIASIEGEAPLVIATSAREMAHDRVISFYDQEKVWSCKKPVLFIFGTGNGLTEEKIKQADFLLRPIDSFSDFNHLSVRSATAIVLDRWLGINEKSA